MPLASGQAAILGVARETTYGTYAAPTKYYELLSEDLGLEIERLEAEGIAPGRRTLHRWAPSKVNPSGSFEIEVPNRGLGPLLRAMMGSDYTVGGTGPYNHFAKPSDLAGESLSITVVRPQTDGTRHAWRFTGCKVTEWTFSAEVGAYGKLQVNVVGKQVERSTTIPTPSYSATLAPFHWGWAGFAIDGSVRIPVRSFNVQCNNNLETDRFYLGVRAPGAAVDDRTREEPLEAGVREITGTVSLHYNDQFFIDKFMSGAEGDIVAGFNVADGDSQLRVILRVRYDGALATVSGRDLLEQEIPFKAVSSTSDEAAYQWWWTTNEATP